jgi:hypothetical protein
MPAKKPRPEVKKVRIGALKRESVGKKLDGVMKVMQKHGFTWRTQPEVFTSSHEGIVLEGNKILARKEKLGRNKYVVDGMENLGVLKHRMKKYLTIRGSGEGAPLQKPFIYIPLRPKSEERTPEDLLPKRAEIRLWRTMLPGNRLEMEVTVKGSGQEMQKALNDLKKLKQKPWANWKKKLLKK